MRAAATSHAVVDDPSRRGHSAGDTARVLASIHSADVSLAIWRRTIPVPLQRSLARLLSATDLDVDRVILAGAHAPFDAVPELGASPAATFLREDVAKLLTQFVELAGAGHVRLVLGVKRTDACRKFHADNVRLRLLTTYVGPGTEWLPNSAVDRAVLAHPPECAVAANRAIVRDSSRIERARAGDVLLLKGERYGGAPGAVHRSPPIEALGLARLVLALSTVDS